jgi:hypothetical protein
MTAETTTPGATGLGLVWPIKASFVAYVLGMEDGELSVADGATVSATQVFTFEPATASAPAAGDPTFDVATRQGTLSFRGSVSFVAHYGMLAVTISNPTIEFGQDSTVLAATTGDQRIVLAALSLPTPETEGSRLAWIGAVPRLTAAGADLFNGVYPAGHELDPLDIVVDLTL